jgi:hypothetical protein
MVGIYKISIIGISPDYRGSATFSCRNEKMALASFNQKNVFFELQ